ncbi:hypothetical protein FIBSPDRAFT_961223 [Athelia psychrophila]|uniref:Uncharacterized protein n=1 Tax=Athelia psychrophila TaxID=1759441 RepID=A0A166BH81_9AGAM|nr:hypothetical protein FIBSPDRAFT_961223 [Fibularhizoctonia sp. CBS 109695]
MLAPGNGQVEGPKSTSVGSFCVAQNGLTQSISVFFRKARAVDGEAEWAHRFMSHHVPCFLIESRMSRKTMFVASFSPFSVCDVNSQGGYHGNALQAAADDGDHTNVQLLLEHGADVNAEGGH